MVGAKAVIVLAMTSPIPLGNPVAARLTSLLELKLRGDLGFLVFTYM
jgi:hypothetical protein